MIIPRFLSTMAKWVSLILVICSNWFSGLNYLRMGGLGYGYGGIDYSLGSDGVVLLDVESVVVVLVEVWLVVWLVVVFVTVVVLFVVLVVVLEFVVLLF